MTSNRPLEEWGKLQGDVPMAGAILDGFLHHAQTIAIAGKEDQARRSNPSPTTQAAPEASPRRDL
jgi:DNA replication protein DnaC